MQVELVVVYAIMFSSIYGRSARSMSFNFKDPRKAAVIMCSILLVVCIGLITAAIIAKWHIAAIVTCAGFAICCILVLLAAFNRKTTLRDYDFTYRTWLGNEYQYEYKDVIWYHLAEHDVWVYTQEKRLVVDTDSENGLELAKKLADFGVPDKEPGSNYGVYDPNGEQAKQVLYLEQRKSMFWVMIGLAITMLLAGPGLIVYGFATDDAMAGNTAFLILWPLAVIVFVLNIVYQAFFSLNVRVELYKDHFIYRNAFLKRRSYSYRDCVSRRVKYYQNSGKRYKAHIRTKDGSKIIVDERIINEGFGAAIGFGRLPTV